MTTKGMLIRSILFSTPRRFDIYGESYYVLFVSFFVAAAAMGTVLPTFIDNFSAYHVVIRTMNALTVSIPAILPVCMSVGLLFAYARLYLNKIYCSQPKIIDSAGRVSTMVFDKTGTLTHEGLKAVGIKVSNGKTFDRTKHCSNTLTTSWAEIDEIEPWKNPNQYESEVLFCKFIECMAWWHSWTEINGELIGDPLETEMFQISKWIMDENEARNKKENGSIYLSTYYPRKLFHMIQNQEDLNENIYKLWMVQRNDFSSELRYMSVVVENKLDDSLIWFMKGSPEAIKDLCDPNHLPLDFDERLDKITQTGFRTIALAYRVLDSKEYSKKENQKREELERVIYSYW